MPEGCIPLARSVAVLSADATMPRAARLATLDRSAAFDALDALVAARVIRAGEPLHFEHPILRAAIYDELPPGERSRLHQDAARLLTDEGAELDAVAAQLVASEPTGSTEVIEQLRHAAAGALRRGGPDSAVTYLRRALREGGDRNTRAAISFELATAARFATQPAVMLEHYRQAHQLATEPVLRNTAALELAIILVIIGGWDEPLAIARDALAELGTQAPELTVRLESFRALTAALDPRLVDEYDRRMPMLRGLVERHPDPARALLVGLASVSASRGGDCDEAAAQIERAWDDGKLVGIPFDRWAPWFALLTLVVCERLDLAREFNDTLMADARARGSLFQFLLGSAYGGLIESRSGHLVAAEGMLRTAIEGTREHNLFFELPWQLYFAGDVMLERPEAADLVAVAEDVDLGPKMEVHSGAMVLEVRGRVRHLAGRTAEAIADLRRAGEIYTALKFRNPAAHAWRSALALMLPASERDEALALARSELEDAERLGGARAIGVALRAVGLLEGGADGRDMLQRAVTVLADSPARLERARALVDLGASMRPAGDRAAAREPLQAGMDIAADAGATRLIEYARSELAATGARPRRLRMTGMDSLTPSELRIARLAAEGRTNKEVAQALFITPKTVDTHLGHIYMKLNISSRRELAGALADPVPPADEPR
jgi:DNA-binding CsgD family transcriptional regulator